MNINPFDILKNAHQMQEQLGSIQEKLGSILVTGASGGGMVEVDVTGKMEVLEVRIKPEAVDPADISMLEDLVTSAVSQALEKMREKISEEVGSIAGNMGISIPGLLGN
jgi:DNA-binding YbaB/EbfC family protein